MFNNLDASIFEGAVFFYENEFEEILSKIISCYQIIIENESSIDNDENKIRDEILLKYLKNDLVRKEVGLIYWHFEREVQEDKGVGRTDIKIISPNTFKKQEAYYIIECKRLNNVNVNGTTGLNAEYIKNGICRFTSQYYSSYHKVNGMIGFIVQDLDIHSNANCISKLMKDKFPEAEVVLELTKCDIVEGFEYSYQSQHLDIDKNNLIIHHLMLDFSSKIKAA